MSLRAVLLLLLVLPAPLAVAEEPAARPNIVWISAEDLSPDLGCYGDEYAHTPSLDRLAAEGVRYTRAFSHAGVCAPARSGIITGMYPPSIGTQHMRCQGHLPPYVKCFTEYLRDAGYYCTNNGKTDYQFDPPQSAWDASNNQAHWRNRQPGQPFFAVFNFMTTHESQIRTPKAAGRMLDPQLRHDPAEAKLPPYYPDTPVTRADWAYHADNVTALDRQVQTVLDELEAAGLADDTIVWFWGDHGRGLPRAKRWVYDSGIHVPLLIRVPEKWRKLASPGNPDAVAPGSVNEELVAFVDFAPTMLSLAGVEIPAHLQGQAFLGPNKAPPREYIYAHRDRMDERYDLIRAVRDKRYKYIRNYLPEVTRAQHIQYMDLMPTMQEMRRLFAAGELSGPQLQFFAPSKPLEELYDTQADPHEVDNLAGDPQYRDVLQRLRAAHRAFMRESGDTGLLPEGELDRLKQPNDWREKLAQSELLQRLLEFRALDHQGEKACAAYLQALRDPAAALRYWAAIGLRRSCPANLRDSAQTAIRPLLADPSASVRVAAADTLCRWGAADAGLPVLVSVLKEGTPNERLLAAGALDQLDSAARPAEEELIAATKDQYRYARDVADTAVRQLQARRSR